MSGGLKFDNNKPSISLIPNKSLLQVAEVFDFGAKKYGRYNFRKGMEWSRVIDAAYRHLGAFNDGEDLDKESNKSHLAHLGCCVMMLLTFLDEHPELDDRHYKNGETKREIGNRVSSEPSKIPGVSESKVEKTTSSNAQGITLDGNSSNLLGPRGNVIINPEPHPPYYTLSQMY